jgi:protein-tyrosine phosphatase
VSLILSLARLVGRGAKRVAVQMAHPIRRRGARRAAAAARPAAVLFVCWGNICRSPYAAARLQATLTARPAAHRINVASAGLFGPGRPSPDIAIEVARARGIDLLHHRSRLVTATDGAPSVLVVVMEPSHTAALRTTIGVPAHALVLGDFDPDPIATRVIPDPVEGGEAVFHECFARIDRCVAALADALTATSGEG